MSQTDNKQAQQNYGRFHSLVTLIQRHPYISLATPSLILIITSIAHLLVNDKTLQTIFQVIVYISGIIIGAILFLIADNQRKADSSKINLIFLCGIYPATLLGFVYFSKIIGDTSAIFGIAFQIALAIYAKTGKSKESNIQENLSNPSTKFIQENSSTSIQNNSPISIQNNSNSPISIQNHITTNQNVTNIVDKRSERDRATASACKMLDSKDLTSRISAVKTLANLADSWLEDDPTCKKDEKKCQDIIDILCAYIRSPFPLAQKAIILSADTPPTDYAGDFFTDQASFREEQDVRRTIFVEMSKRSSNIIKKESKVIKTASGKWSDFNFDFSRAPIFYLLSNLTIEQGNFSGAKVYIDANFSEAAFTRRATFIKAVFTRNADFSGARFANSASFSGAKFANSASFSGAAFTRRATFSEARFIRRVNFSGATFTRYANFSGATFTLNANFSGATFIQRADFNRVTFTRSANFSGATFIQRADFNRVTFTSSANFTKARFRKFKPTFATKLEHAQFSAGTSPQNYMFSVAPGSKPINRKPATLLGKTFNIPLGTVLFDPDSPKDQQGNYTIHSGPAK